MSKLKLRNNQWKLDTKQIKEMFCKKDFHYALVKALEKEQRRRSLLLNLEP